MIKIEKQATVTIDGEDVQALKDICVMAKRYIQENKEGEMGQRCTEWTIKEYDNKAYCRIDSFFDKVFSET